MLLLLPRLIECKDYSAEGFNFHIHLSFTYLTKSNRTITFIDGRILMLWGVPLLTLNYFYLVLSDILDMPGPLMTFLNLMVFLLKLMENFF